jgi:hypothetical protein
MIFTSPFVEQSRLPIIGYRSLVSHLRWLSGRRLQSVDSRCQRPDYEKLLQYRNDTKVLLRSEYAARGYADCGTEARSCSASATYCK